MNSKKGIEGWISSDRVKESTLKERDFSPFFRLSLKRKEGRPLTWGSEESARDFVLAAIHASANVSMAL